MKLLPFVLLFCSCGTTPHPSTPQDTIRVKAGESFEIKLATNMGTGYSWLLPDSTFRKNLSLDTVYVINDPEKDNAMDTQVFRFTALRKSSTRLLFQHKRPWKKEEKPDQEQAYLIMAE